MSVIERENKKIVFSTSFLIKCESDEVAMKISDQIEHEYSTDAQIYKRTELKNLSTMAVHVRNVDTK
jgi:hypothetical protein